MRVGNLGAVNHKFIFVSAGIKGVPLSRFQLPFFCLFPSSGGFENQESCLSRECFFGRKKKNSEPLFVISTVSCYYIESYGGTLFFQFSLASTCPFGISLHDLFDLFPSCQCQHITRFFTLSICHFFLNSYFLYAFIFPESGLIFLIALLVSVVRIGRFSFRLFDPLQSSWPYSIILFYF